MTNTTSMNAGKPGKILSGSLFLSTCLAALSVSQPALAQTASSPEASAASGGVQDIVVTAQRREENLQKVPISITAISSAAIENARITNVQDLSAVAPNLVVAQSGGGGAIPTYSMRGVVAGNSIAGADNGISVYIDGVFVDRLNGSLLDMADLERIEVLKGPQGTLFGRNSTGGAISIVTRQPTGKFGVSQEFSVGNYRQFRSNTRVDLPAWGPFSASVSYFHDQRRGDMRNLGAGQTLDYGPLTGGEYGKKVSPKYLGDNNTNAVQAKLKFDPGGGFEATYKFDYTDLHDTANGQGLLAFGPLASGGGLAQLIYATQPNPSILTPMTDKRPDAVNNSYSAPEHVRNWGHTLVASYHASDTISFKDILAYRATNIDGHTQLDGAGGMVVTAPVASALGMPNFLIGSPITLLGVNPVSRQHQWSNEFQILINTQWFNLTSGLYYFESDLTAGGHGVDPIALFALAPGGNVFAKLVPPSEFKAISLAAYTQATFHLTDKLDLVGGLRITKDKKHGIDTTGYSNTGEIVPFQYRNSKPTWLVGLNYQAAPNLMAYAKASTGFISGGRLGGLDYRPETVLSYETGVKADLLDHKLRTNLAVFYAKYDDQQFAILGPTGGQGYLNAGKSRAWGAELETTFVPVHGLTLQANAGYTNFKYTQITAPGVDPNNFFPAVRPRLTASGTIEYQSQPMAIGRVLARIDGNYHSTYYGTSEIPAQLSSSLVSPRTLLINGRLGLTDIPVANTRANISLWVRNLTDQREVTGVANLSLVYSAVYEPARTFGLDIGFAF